MSSELAGSDVSDIGAGIISLVLVRVEVRGILDLEGSVHSLFDINGGVWDGVAFVARLDVLDARSIDEWLKVVIAARV